MIKINLQTAAARKQRRRAVSAERGAGGSSTLLPAMVLLLPIVGGAGGSYYVHATLLAEIDDTQQAIQSAEAELARLKPILDELNRFKKDKALLEQKLGAIRALQGARIGPVKIYAELASLMPAQVWVTGVRESGGNAVLDGLGLDSQSIAVFVNSLQRSPYFTNVELTLVEQTKYLGLSIKRFNVTCRFRNPDAPQSVATATTPARPPAGGAR